MTAPLPPLPEFPYNRWDYDSNLTFENSKRSHEDYAKLAVREALEQAEPAQLRHVCGLQGFGRGAGSENDVCPACTALAKVTK